MQSSKFSLFRQLILSKTVTISEDLEITCGYDSSMQFKPSLVLSQSTDTGRKEEIKFNMVDWLTLSGLKNHIHIQLSANHTEAKKEVFTVLNIESAIFSFQYEKHFATTLMIRQLGWQIEIDADDWSKLFEKKDLIDGFFLWAEYARNTIFEFYHKKYIPACIEHGVWYLNPDQYSHILPKHKKEFYVRLCKEFEHLKSKIYKDISKIMKE